MAEKKRLLGNFKLLHPKNLEKEVHVYGYHFSWKSNMVWMIGAMLGISAVGILFQLRWLYFMIVAAAVVLVVPVLVLDMYRRMYEQKRFSDVCAYMEQMLYAFQKTGKVVSALKETREVFGEGQMRRCIEEAILHTEFGRAKSEGGILRESLQIIENCYMCGKLGLVHKLLLDTEEYGGEAEESIVLVLEDIERFRKRGYSLQAKKKRCHTDNMISIVVATFLCAVALYVLDAMKDMFAAGSAVDIFKLPVIQVSSTVFILLLLQIYVKSARRLTEDWLAEKELHDPAYILRSYDMIVCYDAGKEKKRGMIFAGIWMISAAAFLVIGKRIPGMACLLASAFFLLQPGASYRLANRDVTAELYQALPQWLFEMLLLLQNNNVQVALAKSAEGAHAVLTRELVMLQERIAERPDSLKSYVDFCGKFDLPEMTSCMKMLHAFSESGTGNIRVQMNHLLERVVEMQESADEMQNDSIAFRMKLIFSYPVAAATVKLLIDLSVGMIVMMQILGNMGGM